MQDLSTRCKFFALKLIKDRVLSKSLLTRTIEHLEKHLISQALKNHEGNFVHTAEFLGISRSTLYAKIKEYGIV